MNAQFCVSSGFQKRGGDNVLSRVNRGGAALARFDDQIFQFRTQEADRNFRWKQTEFVPIERGYDDVPLEPFFEQDFLQIVAEPGILQFDVKNASRSKFLKHIGKERDRLAITCVEFFQFFIWEIRNAAYPIGGTVDGVVMNHDHPPIAAPANIELKACRAAT